MRWEWRNKKKKEKIHVGDDENGVCDDRAREAITNGRYHSWEFCLGNSLARIGNVWVGG